ncbi:ecotropic viral integration site 5 ortholog-like isoform X2 [Gigantopelta aegis]|uniref:ecotropic viral integration site 5 ortholog-like isoform X2 n=1 Tax=Gigantopelta aegis TaxID=1735272 RepID=UPI001B88906F|nr:ecotropic viral integration site 5 ortholog-like isoform X2 [Gigantopelta aegis]
MDTNNDSSTALPEAGTPDTCVQSCSDSTVSAPEQIVPVVSTSACSLPDTPIDDPELELLAKLEEANRQLEADDKLCKSLAGVSPTPSHSRKGSGSSVVSSTSSNSHFSCQVSYDEDIAAEKSETSWETWGRLVNDWESYKKKSSYLRDLIRKGIPHHFRGLAWQLLLGVHESHYKQLYADYLKKNSPSEKLIRRDIARTFPDHDFFKKKDGLGQESLFNVMKAYSLHDREVGYCQGSGFIVGLLLMEMPEEEAFAVLVRLMQDYRLRELFKPSMAELGLCMYKLECLIQELLPDLHQHFQTQYFHTSMYASSWFLTLYVTSFNLSLACRIMDLFISEGMEMIFRVGIAILQSSQEYLLSQDMEGMLKFFQKDLRSKYESDVDGLLQTAYQVRYSSKKMKKLEKEYTALKSKENEEQIELRRLRTENRLLRQRIDNLEKESAALADRLIQDQVIRAQEAEESYALKNELSVLRQQHHDAQRKLEEADVLIAEIKRRGVGTNGFKDVSCGHWTKCMDDADCLDEEETRNMIRSLQAEMIGLRLKESETAILVKELRSKIKDLEDTNLDLQRAPSNDIQHLQEELIAVKLREAEANLSLKEVQQKVKDIEQYWEKHMERQYSVTSPKEKNSKQEIKHLQEELMTVKIKETKALVEVKDTKQKVMELETQNHICSNQIRRMDESNKSLKSRIEESLDTEKELKNHIKELRRKIDDMETKKKEETMLTRIMEAEHAQIIAEYKQKIANLEIQKEELLAAGQLHGKTGTQDLENQIYDLKDEVLQLKLNVSPKTGEDLTGEYAGHEDSDDEVSEALEDSSELNKTLSEIVERNSGPTLCSVFENGEDSLLPNGDVGGDEVHVCDADVPSHDSIPAGRSTDGSGDCAEEHSTEHSEEHPRKPLVEKSSEDVPVDNDLPDG